MNNQAEAGKRINKDAIVRLMLKHAVWLAEAAKRDVDVQSWKEFAETEILSVDEDVEMDELEYEDPAHPTPGSPAASAPLPKRKRVRPRARP